MGRYCIKRLLSAIPLLLVISFLIFMFIHLIPGDPARMVAGMDATEQQVQVVREQLGLDKPILTQYVDYMKGYSPVTWATLSKMELPLPTPSAPDSAPPLR